MAYDTLLVLSGMGIAPYSARGVKQTIAAIGASANVRRTVNGALVSLGQSQFQKYESKISCDDMNSPAADGIFPGAAIVVDCVAELAYLTGGTPQRAAVDGSERVVGAYTFYRPRLTMMLTEPIEIEEDEWGAAVSWSISLQEV